MAERWFAVEWLEADTAAISEPLHWERPHCYLLLGTRCALLIDTGLGVSDLAAQVRALTDLPVLAAVTHAHWDHLGGLGAFARRAVHTAEAPWLAGHFPLPPAAVRAQLTREPCPFPPGFDPAAYTVFAGGATQFLRDGQILHLGGRQIQVCHTPGHSPGHVCFWEAARGALFPATCSTRGSWTCSIPPRTRRPSFGRHKKWPRWTRGAFGPGIMICTSPLPWPGKWPGRWPICSGRAFCTRARGCSLAGISVCGCKPPRQNRRSACWKMSPRVFSKAWAPIDQPTLPVLRAAKPSSSDASGMTTQKLAPVPI